MERGHIISPGRLNSEITLYQKVIDVGLVAGFVGRDDKGSDELLVGRVDGALYGAIEVLTTFLMPATTSDDVSLLQVRIS